MDQTYDHETTNDSWPKIRPPSISSFGMRAVERDQKLFLSSRGEIISN